MFSSMAFRVFGRLQRCSLTSKVIKSTLLNRYKHYPTSIETTYSLGMIYGELPDELEHLIASDCFASYYYALSILHRPFPLGEAAIAGHAHYSRLYAERVLHGVFPLGETAIARSDHESAGYFFHVVCKNRRGDYHAYQRWRQSVLEREG